MRYRIFVMCLCAAVSSAAAGEGEQWASDATRNMAMDVSDLPDRLGEENLLWRHELRGRMMYGQPTVAGDRIVVGGDGRLVEDDELKRLKPRGSIFCVDAVTGERLWEMPTGWGHYGVCSTPVIEGDRVYIVGSKGDMLCLDLHGLANGNDGPFTDEAAYFSMTNESETLTDLKESFGDILWMVNMREQLGVEWHDAPSGSPLLLGDHVWVTTSQSYHTNEFRYEHGILREIDRWGPNIAVFDKRTGKVLATDDIVVPATYHGQWSSLTSGVVANGERRVFWGDGYGYLRAFSAKLPQGAGAGGEPATIKQLWWCDVNPPDYRTRDGVPLPYPTWRDSRGIREGKVEICGEGPCEIISTPLFWNGRVYAILGRDYMYQLRKEGRAMGDSCLVCIDANVTLPAKRRFNPPPSVTDQAILWSTREVGRGMSSMGVADGLLYVADTAGFLNCFDALSGQKLWAHDLGTKVWASSPLIADGKVYVGSAKGDFFILRAAREKEVLWTGETKAEITTPTAVDGVLYVFSARELTAYGSRDALRRLAARRRGK